MGQRVRPWTPTFGRTGFYPQDRKQILQLKPRVNPGHNKLDESLKFATDSVCGTEQNEGPGQSRDKTEATSQEIMLSGERVWCITLVLNGEGAFRRSGTLGLMFKHEVEPGHVASCVPLSLLSGYQPPPKKIPSDVSLKRLESPRGSFALTA